MSGLRVTIPVPRGKNERPTSDSITEDFPELYSEEINCDVQKESPKRKIMTDFIFSSNNFLNDSINIEIILTQSIINNNASPPKTGLFI